MKQSFWEPYMEFHTTAEFQKEGKGYVRHCGPTAVTNLVLAIRNRAGRNVQRSANDVFRESVSSGRRTLAYHNMDFLGRFGGTSDLLAGIYLRVEFRRAGIREVRVRAGLRPGKKGIFNALWREELVYLEVHKHPKYGNHHLLLYGYEIPDEEVDPECDLYEVYKDRMLFLAADGWVRRPVRLTGEDLRRATYFRIIWK